MIKRRLGGRRCPYGLVVLALLLALTGNSSLALAQETPAAVPVPVAEPPPAPEAPKAAVAPAPAVTGTEKPAAAADIAPQTKTVPDDTASAPDLQPATDQPATPSKETFLQWMVRASGAIGLVILLMSFYLVAVVVWMQVQFRRSVAVPRALVQELEELLSRKQYDRAYGRVSADGSFLGKVLTSGLRKLPQGIPAAHRAMELANEDVTMEMEHRTTYLATVGTLGPMIGLIGTVYGMIRSFEAIAVAGATPEANQLARGISTALFLTLEGIAVSVPAIAFYALFRNRIARVSLEVQRVAEGFLDRFAPAVRSPHPLVSGAASSSPGRQALPPRES